MPSHSPGHVPSLISITATAVPIAAIAAVAATSEVLHANAFSLWNGDNSPPEVPEAQERFAGPCRRVQVVTAVATWGGRGELTVWGSKGPT